MDDIADRSVVVALKAETASFIAGMRAAGTAASASFDDAVKAASRNQQALTDVGTAALGLGAAAGVGVGVAVAKFADFDQAMSNVRAATHETAGNMDILREATLAAGAASVFSATEVAGGVEELAKAGIATADILGGGLTGALDLAAAGGLGVAESAETMATALTQFNLEGEQATHVADLLAAGAGKAQGSVHDMGMALNQAGLIASQVGLSIEETTGTLALFASAGLIGSDAGTSFRTMLLRLTNPTGEAAELMGDLGIKVYDAQGSFVGMESVAGQLQSTMGGLDEETRNAALGTLFGSDAIRAASLLYKEGAQGVEEWTGAVNDTGYAAETARIRMDNLRGDLEKLSGALDTALINLGEAGDAPLRGLIQNLTGLVEAFDSLDPRTKSVVIGAAAVTAGLGLLGGATLLLIPRIAATKLALTELGVTAGATATALKAAAVATGVFAAAWAATEGINNIQEWQNTRVEVEGLSGDLKELGETGVVTGELLSVFGDDLSGVTELLARSPDGFNHWVDDLEGNFESVKRIDEQLAAMVESGNIDTAAAAFDKIALATSQQYGTSLTDVTSHFPEYAEAAEAAGTAVGTLRAQLLASAEAQRMARPEIEGIATAHDDITVAAEAAADAQVMSAEEAEAALAAQREEIDELLDAYKSLNQINMGVGESEAAREQALDDLAATIGELTGAVDANGEAINTSDMAIADIIESYGGLDAALNDTLDGFDVTSQAGRDLQASLYAVADTEVAAAEAARDYATAHGTDARTANEDFAASLDVSRENLSLTLQSMGLGAEAADALALSIIGVPDISTTEMKVEDEEAKRKVAEHEERLRLLAIARTTKIDVDPSGAMEGVDRAQQYLDSIRDGYATIHVGFEIVGFGGTSPGVQEGLGDGWTYGKSTGALDGALSGATAGTGSLADTVGGSATGPQYAQAPSMDWSALAGAVQAGFRQPTGAAAAAPAGSQASKTAEVNLTINQPVNEASSDTIGALHDLSRVLAGV